MPFEFERFDIADVVLVKPKAFGDERGFFCETYRVQDLAEAGITTEFVQDNHSRSSRGVLRGLHFQTAGQEKLVRCARGRVWDVAVDLRRSSPTYKRWVGVALDDENMYALFVPRGFAHGFVVLSDVADVCYKVGPVYYSGDGEGGIRWDDPDIGVAWPVADPVVSARDVEAPTLAEIEAALPDW